MKRNVKRILSLALVLALVLSLSVPAFAEGKTRQHPGINSMITFGTSISFGCAIHESSPGVWDFGQTWHEPFIPTEGCFEYVLQNEMGIGSGDDGVIPNVTQGARNGWRTVEARMMLEPGFMGDDVVDYTRLFCALSDGERLWSPTTPGYPDIYDVNEGIAAWQDIYIPAVQNADLITLEFGSDELSMNLVTCLQDFMEANPAIGETLAGLTAVELTEQLTPDDPNLFGTLAQIFDLLEQIGMFGSMLNVMIEGGARGLQEFCYNWNALIRRLRELNPDAIIVALSMHNPLSSMQEVLGGSLGGLELLLDVVAALSDVFISPLNAHMAFGPYAYETVYCDISDLDMSGTVDGMHPGLIGHRQLAEKIANIVRSYYPCEHPADKTEIYGEVAPTMLTLGYTGDKYCNDCRQILSRGRVVSIRETCKHENTYTVGAVAPTVKTAGMSGTVLCSDCGFIVENSVILPKLKCEHEHTNTVGTVKATKLVPGYTGDIYCKDCGKLVNKGVVTKYSDVCPHTHQQTGVGAIKATILHSGYSGNTVCKDCGKILRSGEPTYFSLFR